MLCSYLKLLQTFDVKLLAVATVGASLGDDVSVLVGILPSDSPSGIFSISPSQVRQMFI